MKKIKATFVLKGTKGGVSSLLVKKTESRRMMKKTFSQIRLKKENCEKTFELIMKIFGGENRNVVPEEKKGDF